jgi:hypothetical protein
VQPIAYDMVAKCRILMKYLLAGDQNKFGTRLNKMKNKDRPKKNGEAQTKSLNPPRSVAPFKLAGQAGTTKSKKHKTRQDANRNMSVFKGKPHKLLHTLSLQRNSALGIMVHYREEIHTLFQMALIFLDLWLRA